jgi:hypothetical protein
VAAALLSAPATMLFQLAFPRCVRESTAREPVLACGSARFRRTILTERLGVSELLAHWNSILRNPSLDIAVTIRNTP